MDINTFINFCSSHNVEFPGGLMYIKRKIRNLKRQQLVTMNQITMAKKQLHSFITVSPPITDINNLSDDEKSAVVTPLIYVVAYIGSKRNTYWFSTRLQIYKKFPTLMNNSSSVATAHRTNQNRKIIKSRKHISFIFQIKCNTKFHCKIAGHHGPTAYAS